MTDLDNTGNGDILRSVSFESQDAFAKFLSYQNLGSNSLRYPT